MKKLFLFLVLISVFQIIDAQKNEFVGLMSFYPVYSFEHEEAGGGFEVAGIKDHGVGVQVEHFPLDSLSTTSGRAFVLWRVTNNYFIKTALGINVENPKEKRYPDYVPSAGIGFVYLTESIFYLGSQVNLRLEKIAPTVSFTVGIKFN